MSNEYLIMPGYDGEDWFFTSDEEAVEGARAEGRLVFFRPSGSQVPEEWKWLDDE